MNSKIKGPGSDSSRDGRSVGPERVLLGSATVKTVGCYLGVADEKLLPPVARKWDLIRIENNDDGHVSAIPQFNDWLKEGADRQKFLTWLYLFDGVFRIDAYLVRDEDRGPESERSEHFIGCAGPKSGLFVPSGRLMLFTLELDEESGSNAVEFAIIKPGRYDCVLLRYRERESTHEMLDLPSQYQQMEGPDAELLLTRSEGGIVS